ncbi:transposase [Bradyrhizobium elkanii]|nr:transposase [Bradyrhizobium elkanii]MCP1750951.1 transposase [Bradyrhizobium elkanii]MCP1976725.1 transposase [Bradyrhizobium elkanii]MCS3523881.1 transposase [Bradyrhizobium elkanii]MCS3888757.1 transposase [Bradyrhizobium elkanii]MCS4071537.1 transposase [Bradyrhizobium elkanii]
MLAIEDTIRGLLKVHGLKLGLVHRARFATKVEALLAHAPELRLAIEPLLDVRNAMRVKKALLDRQLSQMARKDEVCRRLMTVSGVGPIVSLSFKATIDDHARFKDPRAAAAHLGLTPRAYQSGEIDPSGNICKCGDKLMRHALYEAANSHLRIAKKWSVLRA